MTETAPQKKISLNFKTKAAASVKEIAAATVGSDSATDLKQHLLRRLDRMDRERMEFRDVLKVSGMFVEVFCDDLERIYHALGDLERARRHSPLNWLLGYPAVTQQKIDGVSALIPRCDGYEKQLIEKAEKIRSSLREKQARDDETLAQALQVEGPDGVEIRARLHKLRESFENEARCVGNATSVFDNLARQCAEVQGRAAHAILRQQAVLQVKP